MERFAKYHNYQHRSRVQNRMAVVCLAEVPMLCGAILAGAFYNSPNQDELCELDYLLNYQQLKHHGPITPWTKPRCRVRIDAEIAPEQQGTQQERAN
eukprot:3631156-Amphidinium_carterae.1